MDEREAELARRIGAAVRHHRQLRGFSQEVLAERVDLSTHFIGLVERGQQLPSLTTLLALSHALGVSLDDVLQLPEAAPPASWEQKALAVLGTVPKGFRPGVLAMLNALARTTRRGRVRR